MIEKKIETKIPGSEIIDLDLIKINMPAMLITYIIKSILFKKKIIILSEESFLYNHIINFFNYILKIPLKLISL